MENEKYYFSKSDVSNINGYTKTKFEDINGNLLDGFIEVENPPKDLLENFIKYKVIEGMPVKMTEEEFKNIYPNYGVEPEQVPTEQDKINAMLLAKIALLEAKEITKNV